MKVLISKSTRKASYSRGPDHSVNRQTLKAIFLCTHPLPKSRLLPKVSSTARQSQVASVSAAGLCAVRSFVWR